MISDELITWKVIGILATLAIMLAFPLYGYLEQRRQNLLASTPAESAARFVGSQACRDCHKPEYDKWQGSHHERAMAVAGVETVRGDFNNARFDYFGTTTRFYRRDGKFMVHTTGPDGKPDDFQITHTFGWYPLQQYLIPFQGGRLQCLPIAWDSRAGRWFHLYPERPLAADDWLYWTNNGQNWNGMCAECHSTDLRKNYDAEKDVYHTAWSEISVGCEACHGPGSAHVRWAELPAMGRPLVAQAALTVRTRELGSRQQIELCAPCHSRRMSLGDNIHNHKDFLDFGIPQLLGPGLYFADGQILDEVYVYGSFLQSKMYARDVRCSDCHDVHSVKRIKEGNALCLQCHPAAVYDTKEHHFHKKKGESGEPIKAKTGEVLFAVGTGAQCELCHMPGRVYMGVDYRPDHGFRIPQPAMGQDVGAPNACNRCHGDKTAQWSQETMTKWYGQRKRFHYGSVLARGRQNQPKALPDLIRLAEDRLNPTIVRATALSQAAAYTDTAPESRAALKRALGDESSLVRHTAVRSIPEPNPRRRLQLLGPLLYDEVKAVRMEAAAQLADIPVDTMSPKIRKRFKAALAEYLAANRRLGDFAASRHNLGNLASTLGKPAEAIDHYKKAIAIDDKFYPAKVNLATLYNRQGNNAKAEKLLRQVTADHPELYEAAYSLGLLLAELKKFREAADFLARAATGIPQRHRIHYNLGLLRQHLGQADDAEASLKRAIAMAPENPDYLYALAVFYLQQKRLAEAEEVARRLQQFPAGREIGEQLLKAVENARSE